MAGSFDNRAVIVSLRRDIAARAGFWVAVFALAVCPHSVKAQSVGEEVSGDPLSDYVGDYLATYSIIALDRTTGQLGMGVQSKAFGAGNRAMTAKGGVAMIAHQASANPMYGPMSIELIERGYSPEEALGQLLRGDEGRDRRQNAIIDSKGRTAVWTGSRTSDWAGHHCGVDFCAQGNILTGPEVVQAMAESFESSSGPLAERLMDALDAAQEEGGDARGMQSGAILVVKPRVRGAFHDRVVDIRVDDHRTPLAELRRILDLQRSGEMLRDINPLIERDELANALDRAHGAVSKSPSNDNAYVALADVQLRIGDRDGAMTSLRTAVDLNPGRRMTLPRDGNFEVIRDDPEFLRLIGG